MLAPTFTVHPIDQAAPAMPSALARAERDLAQCRELLETYREEFAALRVTYQQKPTAALADQVREYDQKIAAVQSRIQTARRVRADLLPAHASQVSAAIERPVADAASRLKGALPEIRGALGIIQDASRLPGQAALAAALLVIDTRGLDRLETLAADLLGEKPI